MISATAYTIQHQPPSQTHSGGQPIKLKPIRREVAPIFDKEYHNNAYPERFYTRLRKRGFDYEESRAMAMEMEDKRLEMFGPSKADTIYKVDYKEINAVFEDYDDQANELERQAMEAEEARLEEIERREAERVEFEARGERARQDAEFRLQEERRAPKTSIADVYVENAWQHGMEKRKLDIVRAQHDLFPLLEKTQKEASKKFEEHVFGKYLGEAKPLNAGAAYGKVEKVANGLVRDSNNHVRKGRILRRLAPEHEMPVKVLQIAAGTPVGQKAYTTSGLLKSEQEALMARAHQEHILEVQHDIDSLWQHAQDKHIELPEWYMPTEHGMVNVRDLTNPKKLKDIIEKLPEQAEHERLKLESELHAMEGKRAALAADIEKAELTRDRMAELSRADAAERRRDHEYAESLGKRSKSVQKGKEFIKATKSGGNRALNKSVLGGH